MNLFKNLIEYRELLRTNVKKEIRGKYKGSFLGIVWSFLNPILQIMVYAIVFPFILRNREPNYIAFLACGIFPWTWFTTSISQGTHVILSNGNIIKKIYFPREIMPISIVTAGLVNFMIQSFIILALLCISRIGIAFYYPFFLVIAIIQYFLTLGIVLITSACEVYVRDLEYIVNFFVSLAFYATPILYSPSTLSNSRFAWIFKVNPLSTIILNYRQIFINKEMPDFRALTIVFVESLLLCIIAMFIFRKLEKGFAENL